MPFSTAKPMMAEAEALLASTRYIETDEIISICAQALCFLVREADAYCEAVPYCDKFVPHFTEQLADLIRLLKSSGVPETETFSIFGEIQARAFALVEDMALFVREKTLRKGAATEHPFEDKLLSYFESSGNWEENTGEEVANAYYYHLPISVMKEKDNSPGVTRA